MSEIGRRRTCYTRLKQRGEHGLCVPPRISSRPSSGTGQAGAAESSVNSSEIGLKRLFIGSESLLLAPGFSAYLMVVPPEAELLAIR